MRELEADGGGWSDPLPLDDPDSLFWGPATYTLMGGADLIGEEERYTFFDARDQKSWAAVTAAFPGARVQFPWRGLGGHRLAAGQKVHLPSGTPWLRNSA